MLVDPMRKVIELELPAVGGAERPPPLFRAPRRMKVGIHELTAWREHPRRFANPGAEIGDVADHQRRTDHVEAAGRERQTARVAADTGPRSGLVVEHRHRNVDADDEARAGGREQRQVASRAGADVKRSHRSQAGNDRGYDRLLRGHQRVVRPRRIRLGP